MNDYFARHVAPSGRSNNIPAAEAGSLHELIRLIRCPGSAQRSLATSHVM
jgi:hypothetical protein